MKKRKENIGHDNKNKKKIKAEGKTIRCNWVTSNPLYVAYHDTEWGVPQYNSIKLFEMLCLGGQQAGLSWITVLQKREHYKSLFCDFNPHEIEKFSKNDLDRLLCDPGVIRNRGKLEAIINNSKCYLKMENNGIDFSKFVWSFVNNKTTRNSWKNDKEAPTQTKESKALSNALRKNGFKFVGPIICYAFMQSCGLVNDHITSCICYGIDDK